MVRNRTSIKEKTKAYSILSVSFIYVLLLSIFPIIFLIYLAFTSWYSLKPEHVVFVGINNFITVFKDIAFWTSLKNTIFYVSATVIIELILGFIIALLLNKEIKGKIIYYALLLVPMAFAPVAAALTMKYIFAGAGQQSLINLVLKMFHLPAPKSWLATVPLSWVTLIICDVWVWTSFMTILLLAGLQSLPREPFEAAVVDGASPIGSFRYITLSLMKVPISIALLFRIMDAFKIFDFIFVVTAGGPGMSTEVLSYTIYKQGFFFSQLSYSSVISLVLLVLVIGICTLYLRTLKRTM